MRSLFEVLGVASLFALAWVSAAQAQSANSPPFDTPTVVSGVETVCSGVGVSDADAARWAKYPIKVVLAGKAGQFLGGAAVTLSQGGNALVTVTCGGPWTLFKVPPGHYEISGNYQGETEKATVDAPAAGQGRAVLRFLNKGGAVSPEYKQPTQ